MKLAEFSQIPGVKVANNSFPQTQILQITSDSRKVRPGTLFVAIRGQNTDGHQFLSQAIQQGASAVVCEEGFDLGSLSVPAFQVASGRVFLDSALSLFWKEPSMELLCLGVTGTNGKTTCTYLLEHLLNGFGCATAVMGTIDHHLGSRSFPTQNTTPGPEELHQRLRLFIDHGAKALAMEVSSHALDQRRTESVHFDGVLFTNLTQDHLDYHKDMESYFWSKQRLFDDVLWASRKPGRVSVINIDDPYGARIRTAPQTRLVSFGQTNGDYRFQVRKISLAGMEYAVHFRGQVFIGQTTMVGLHNLYNMTGALALVSEKGFALRDAQEILASFAGVPGRLQRVNNQQERHVFVDYAHTDDALRNVLSALRLVRDQSGSSGRLITVFGCGGDRDKGKRPKMARAAEEFSDLVIVTSDNPRTEDPSQIISDICQGFERADKVQRLTDRREAIRHAIAVSQPGDIVLIAGKGHEDYQILGTTKVDFRDDLVAMEFLK